MKKNKAKLLLLKARGKTILFFLKNKIMTIYKKEVLFIIIFLFFKNTI